ncbi:MAG: VWA domain-containing protein [Candidatus Nanoarchaeia archaeon]|nr:VWA domain-containing protein [Candidatus Nanoarchaeia archaeon]
MISLTFSNVYYLWLLLSLPLLIITHIFVLNYLNRRAVKFANFEAIKRVTGGKFDVKNSRAISKNSLLLLVRLIVLIFMIFSVSGPVLWYTGQASDFDFVVAIDSSSSMLADDFQPHRLDAAKKASAVFLNNIEANANVGIVSFAGTSYVEQSLDEDLKKAEEAINNIKVSQSGGTDIGGAITTSVNILLNSKNPRMVILLTDGQSTVGIPVREAIDYANKNFVTINTIGIGTEEGGTFLRGGMISTLDEKTLTEIAEKTDGKYYRAEDDESLRTAFEDISKKSEKKVPVDISMGLMMLALALLFIEWGLINTKYRTLP